MTQQWDALNEVTQIRRGECAEFSPRRQPAMVSRRFLWNPVDFARTHEPLDDPSVAATALRSTLLSCTSTLASCHESALLRLSGGLDSSIVLACLQSAPRRPRVLAYTHFTSNSPLDPRRWARMAAAHAGCEHIELESTAADIQLSAILDMAPTAEPFSTLMCLVTAAHEQGLLARQGASCDIHRRWWRLRIRQLLHRRSRHSVPAQARAATRGRAVGSRVRVDTAPDNLARTQARVADVADGPVADESRRAESRSTQARHRGRRARMRGDAPRFIRGSQACSTRRGSRSASLECCSVHPISTAGQAHPSAAGPEIVAPIYSQPLIELALRIPADVLFTGGQDRGLARRAFRGDVAAPILNRLWKDRAGDFHEQLIRRNLDWLREIFLDGVLVGEGLLDQRRGRARAHARPREERSVPGRAAAPPGY